MKALFADHLYTNTLSVAAIASPAWLPSVETVSTQAALWLPIAGIFWIGVQVIARIIEVFRDK